MEIQKVKEYIVKNISLNETRKMVNTFELKENAVKISNRLIQGTDYFFFCAECLWNYPCSISYKKEIIEHLIKSHFADLEIAKYEKYFD